MIFQRNLKFNIEQALNNHPVILVTGARQTGKTTLVKSIGKEKNYSFYTFDDLHVMAAAKDDPIGFIAGLPKPVILDEVQRVPEIFLPIKKMVDENRIPGLFVLTGSANPMLIPRLGDSLAGRMEILELYPLSQGELHGKKESFIDLIFNNTLPVLPPSPLSKLSLCNKIITGGYPSVQSITEQARTSWFRSYITTILQRDVLDLAHIEGLSNLPHLLALLATRAGGLLNGAELARSTGLATATLHRYLTLLKTLFFVHLQPPWFSHLGKRLVKSPKVYLVDSGLLSFLIAASPERLLMDTNLLGGIFENFVISELWKQTTWSNLMVSGFHFRTQTGIEVDLILEDRMGRIVGIEMKSSETVTANDFKGLKYLQETVGEKFIRGIVVYSGDLILPFGKNLVALPVSTLWA